MKLPTLLRQIRVDQALSLTDVVERTGISRGMLSQFETGRALPPDRHLAQLELAYGPPHLWYSAPILLMLQDDNGDDE